MLSWIAILSEYLLQSLMKSFYLLFQTGYRWSHVTNRQVSLESTHLLLLHDFERVALQKVAGQKLNASDLGITVRIPKGKFMSTLL